MVKSSVNDIMGKLIKKENDMSKTEENGKSVFCHAINEGLRTKSLEIALSIADHGYNNQAVNEILDMSNKIYQHIIGLDKISGRVKYYSQEIPTTKRKVF